MALWKWEGGRQGGGYRKMKLAQIFNRADCYLIQYPEGFELPEHRDETPHGRHFRLNIFLKGEGDFYAEDVIAQGKENILIVFYAGPNSRKYIGARLFLE